MEEKKFFEERVEPAMQEQRVEPPFQEKLPNSELVLTMGILSIVLSCCCGPFALIPGIIGLIKGNKGVAMYNANPTGYTRSSYTNLNAGRIASIVGLVLIALSIIYTIYSVSTVGWDAYMEQYQQALEQYQ
ncbi:hypothetical protein C7377_0096 [Balneicella halophila]|uniref:Interferon-induced transmembrane protein n=1 Tax=Balneicella halophila TaxID=1537566 RepID=A0A7L4UPX9_BALHA|nr:CCC motif membrane protein [Balneicella halophila]PVX51810.1 hypothetical protein C7377_0096 [Balneicella halophila]